MTNLSQQSKKRRGESTKHHITVRDVLPLKVTAKGATIPSPKEDDSTPNDQ